MKIAQKSNLSIDSWAPVYENLILRVLYISESTIYFLSNASKTIINILI